MLGAEIDPLRYQHGLDPSEGPSEGTGELLTVKLRFKQPDSDESQLRVRSMALSGEAPAFEHASQDLRFASAVAMFGMRLRDSEHDGSSSFELAAEIALDALGGDARGLRLEFVELARLAAVLQMQRASRAETQRLSER